MTSDADLPNKPGTIQQQPRSHKPRQLLALIVTILLSALVAGVSGYLLGIRANQTAPRSTQRLSFQPSPIINKQPDLTTTPSSTSFPSINPVSTSSEVVHWITYTDATMGATFEYPATWELIHKITDNSITGTGMDYRIVFNDTTIPGNQINIFISLINNSDNLSLADFYRNSPDGAERFKNISFQESENHQGVKFEKIVQPYTESDYSPLRETVHNNKVYEISITTPIASRLGKERSSNYQIRRSLAALDAYNHLINTFAFIQ
jgi:hypothetical protein